jgi:hypothetical protein
MIMSERELAVTSEKVRVYDLETRRVTEIPACELAPDMILMTVRGGAPDGTDLNGVWVSRRQFAALPFRGYQHPPLTEEKRQLMRRLSEAFDGVYTQTPEEWEDGFRHDENIDDQIGMWCRAADVFLRFAGPTARLEVRKDVFNVVFACMHGDRRNVRYTVSVQSLTRMRIGQIVDAWFGPEVRPDAAFDVTFGPDPDEASARALANAPVYPLDALERPGFRAVVQSADIVIGFNDRTGRPTLFYGREALERINRTGQPERLKVVNVRYDSRTSQLGFLVACVRHLKGSCCYQAASGQTTS